MASAAIPVDLLNPGQVFACLGFAEAAEVLCGQARGEFDGSDPARMMFRLSAAGDEDPIRAALAFVAEAEVVALAPSGSENSTEKWHVERVVLAEGEPFPYPDPPSPASLPAALRARGTALRFEHWGDETRRDNVKFWAGSGGYPGAALLRDAVESVRREAVAAAADPFALATSMSSSFRFDWRRDYVPMGIGFSLNLHGAMQPQGFPLVEIFAALGLSHARPERPDRRDKLLYRYAVVEGASLPLPLLRAALGGAALPFSMRCFRMRLDWPGQENQARCITDVIEEAPR